MRCFSATNMKYKIFKEKLIGESDVQYFAYGIEIIKSGITERYISDITCSYQKLKKLCLLCNQLEVSPMHIDDVIEDFLCE